MPHKLETETTVTQMVEGNIWQKLQAREPWNPYKLTKRFKSFVQHLFLAFGKCP